MPRDLFGDVQQPTVHVGSRSRYTVPLSLAAHAAVVLAVIGVTILGPVVLPGLASSGITYTTIVMPPAPPPPAPRAPDAPRPPAVNPHAAPTEAPSEILPERPVPFETVETAADGTGIIPGATAFDTIVGDPPPPAPPAPQQPRRPGGNIRPPTRVRDAAPIYPAIAQAARVEGTVIIEAIIATDGRVESARVLRSIPLLDEAALAAVRQWEYTPTLLNGTPVPVIMSVTVTFRLR